MLGRMETKESSDEHQDNVHVEKTDREGSPRSSKVMYMLGGKNSKEVNSKVMYKLVRLTAKKSSDKQQGNVQVRLTAKKPSDEQQGNVHVGEIQSEGIKR